MPPTWERHVAKFYKQLVNAQEAGMEKRFIGASGLDVAPISLGGNVFGWTADEPTSFRILDAFVDAGGTMIDTADVYSMWVPGNSGGESETVIGRWLKRNPGKRDELLIATKVGFTDGLAPETILRGCDASLARLGIERIDLYYQHKDDQRVPLADSLGAFQQLVDAGKIRAIGLSQFTAARLGEAMATAKACGYATPAALQTWYNLIEREKFEPGLRDAATRHGLGVVPFYGLANGFLAGKYRSPEDLGKSVRGQRSAEYLEGRGMHVLDALDEIAAEAGAPVAAVALAWLVAQPTVVSALASATSLEQLAEITAALHLKLTPEQLNRLTAASDQPVPA
jgi:aryl-alcohol dehydrogenase-like predicted oxidoreductase